MNVGASSAGETALGFECEGAWLPAIIHRPAAPGARGVLVVVGGPQYRAGSHRQFVLLGRALAAAGFPAMRFDYRGMGDAEGESRDFRSVGADLRAAVDTFCEAVDSLREVVLWGLCDGATAAADYAPTDTRVTGLVLVNPWVHSERGHARAELRGWYARRLLSRAFWGKVGRGEFDPRRALKDFGQALGTALGWSSPSVRTTPEVGVEDELAARMAASLRRFNGPVLILTSGEDLTASEFRTAAGAGTLRGAVRRRGVQWHELADADHTFSRQDWRREVEARTRRWLIET